MAWVAPKSWVSSDIIADPASELNRIEGNTEYLYDLLVTWALLDAQTHKTDWSIPTEITTALAKRIDDNLHALADAYGLAYTTRDWTGIVIADYRVWNEWEAVCAALYDWATNGGNQLIYCGTLYAGEDGGIY